MKNIMWFQLAQNRVQLCAFMYVSLDSVNNGISCQLRNYQLCKEILRQDMYRDLRIGIHLAL